MFNLIKEILISEEEFTESNYERLKKAMFIWKIILIDFHGKMLAVDSLIEISNITSSNNVTSRKVNAKPYGCDKMYMEKDLIKDKLY